MKNKQEILQRFQTIQMQLDMLEESFKGNPDFQLDIIAVGLKLKRMATLIHNIK